MASLVTEHISEDYLFSLFGHDNFIIERTIKRRRDRSNEFDDLRKWARDKDVTMTITEFEKKVDIKKSISLVDFSTVLRRQRSLPGAGCS